MDPGRLPGFSCEDCVPGLKENVFPISVQYGSGQAAGIYCSYQNSVPVLNEIVFPISVQLNGSRWASWLQF